jgi:two-component system nitrogen regulation sensor histidine kinase NtrY
MRLAPQLVLAFGFVATFSVAGLGYALRWDRRESETRRFDQEVESACERVVAELERQGESDRKLVGGACESGELVDRALIWMQAGTLDDERRLALSRLVPEERRAFDLDELLLARSDGDLLGQDPTGRLPLSRADVARLVSGDVSRWALRASQDPALVSRCRKPAPNGGAGVALVGARHLGPVVERLGKTVDVKVTLGGPPVEGRGVAQHSCPLTDAAGTSISITVSKPKDELFGTLARVDQTVIAAGLAAAILALVLAVAVARYIRGPIAELAVEARKVVSGQARPLRVQGTGEIAELGRAFDTMLDDLDSTRQRLAATSRIAAWREVARRVAHEVKNPLAPIQAAVETLRRLRARQDPQFDAYFDEATRIVLDEVHRISNIVTEFTRFARLPPPRPQDVEIGELVRQVVALHKAEGRGTRMRVVVRGQPPTVRADRDQMVQVLTNLVQNALDAVKDKGDGGEVELTVAAEGPAHVAVTVRDNGPGVSPEIASRLFEPYATTKAQGTGLGLAIAQRIAIEHQGELSLQESVAGEGEVAVAGERGVGGVGARGQRRSAGAAFRLLLSVAGPSMIP